MVRLSAAFILRYHSIKEACFKNTKQLEKEEKKEDNKGKENNKSTIQLLWKQRISFLRGKK